MNDLFIKPVHIITLLIILSLEYMNCQCRWAVCLSITSLKSLLRVFCVWNSLIENWSNKSKFNLLKSSVPFVLFCFVCLSVLFVCLFGLFLKEGGGGYCIGRSYVIMGWEWYYFICQCGSLGLFCFLFCFEYIWASGLMV